MDLEVVLALALIVFTMAVADVLLRKQWADYCARIFFKRSGKKVGRRSDNSHA